MRQLKLLPMSILLSGTLLLSAALKVMAANDAATTSSPALASDPSGAPDPSAVPSTDDLRPALTPSSPPATRSDSSESKSKKVQPAVVQKFDYSKAFKNGLMAKRIARYQWLDKCAQANPEIIEAVTWHHDAAKILARHPRLGDIAEGDHYLCRRLTRWRDVSNILAKNSEADRVIARDPQGMFRAIGRWPGLGKTLAKNPLFNQMVIDVPDLADVLAQHM